MAEMEGLTLDSDPLIGRVIQDRYRIDRCIGKGGMGVVYEAHHLRIGRKLALKVLTARASYSAAAVQRFEREARAAAAVGNSHIVDVIDMGQVDGGSFFIALEHLDGVDLGFAVARERAFSPARAIHVLCQLCDALSAVHAAGIVHRDLKPENVFLITHDGQPDFVKVLDFGVCKFEDEHTTRLTDTGDTVGTPQFMAPEQIEGRRDLDHRTDIYGLGAILYYLLTGRPPFEATSLPSLFLTICNNAVPSVRPTGVPLASDIDRIIARALHKDPAQRYESCEALRAALLALDVPGRRAESVPDDTARALPASKRGSSRKMRSIALAAACGAIVGLTELLDSPPADSISVSTSIARTRPSNGPAPRVELGPIVTPIDPEPAAATSASSARSSRLDARPASLGAIGTFRRQSRSEESPQTPSAGATEALQPSTSSDVSETTATEAQARESPEPSRPSSERLYLNREPKRGL